MLDGFVEVFYSDSFDEKLDINTVSMIKLLTQFKEGTILEGKGIITVLSEKVPQGEPSKLLLKDYMYGISYFPVIKDLGTDQVYPSFRKTLSIVTTYAMKLPRVGDPFLTTLNRLNCAT